MISDLIVVVAQGEASCSSFCQVSWLARNSGSWGGCWALVPTLAVMKLVAGVCPHAVCPGAAVTARVPAQHLLSLCSEAACRTAVLHCGSASWLQNPCLEPYGKTELCQTVWPVLLVFLLFFFLLLLLQAGGGFLSSSPTSMLQGKGVWSWGCLSSLLCSQGLFRCDSICSLPA